MAAPSMLESPATLDRSPAEEALYEIVDGQRVELPSMGAYASLIACWLYSEMDSIVKAARLGFLVMETLFILDAERNLRRRPDLAFVSTRRWSLKRPIPKEGDWGVIPDLAVEVTSPNDKLDHVLKKVDEYFSFAVQKVWVVVPARQNVFVFDSPNRVRILTATDELDGGTLLPGFRLPLVKLFQGPTEGDTPSPVEQS